MSRESTSRVAGADGLRAIACLLVVWHHITQRLNPDQLPGFLQNLHFLGMRGEVGVSLFFVLSGALLSLPFWHSFIHGTARPKLSSYVIHRVSRIVPAFWFNLIFCTLTAWWVFDLQINWWRLISGLLFINSYHFSTFFPAELNGPLWSIGLEVSCYIVLPLVLLTIFKLRRKFTYAFYFLIIWIFALQILNPWIIRTFMTSDDFKGWQYGLAGGAKQWLPYWNFDTFFTQFLLGSLAALIIVQLRSLPISKSIFFDVTAIFALLGALLLVVMRLDPGSPDSVTNQPYLAPLYALLMAIALATGAHGRFLGTLLDNCLFKWIAKISFGIYLWHMMVISFIERKISTDYVYYGIYDPLRWLKISSIVVLISLLIASISWKFLESPALIRARKLTAK